jgi:hypothetical protein
LVISLSIFFDVSAKKLDEDTLFSVLAESRFYPSKPAGHREFDRLGKKTADFLKMSVILQSVFNQCETHVPLIVKSVRLFY